MRVKRSESAEDLGRREPDVKFVDSRRRRSEHWSRRYWIAGMLWVAAPSSEWASSF